MRFSMRLLRFITMAWTVSKYPDVLTLISCTAQ